MPTTRIRLGQLLVDAKLLRQSDLDEVLAIQRADGRRLGTLLLERGLINETQLTQVLSNQLSVPWVSLVHIEFSRQLLNLVPHHVAERYCLVPIYVRHVRGQGQTLYVAMDDPSNEDGLRECEKHTGLPVKAMIAPPSDIRNAIRVYYGIKATPSIPPPDARPSRAPISATPTAEMPSVELLPSHHVKSLHTPSLDFDVLSAAPSELGGRSGVISQSTPELDLVPPDALELTAPPPVSATAFHDLPPETLPDAGASRVFRDEPTLRTRVPVVDASDVPSFAERRRQLEMINDEPAAAPVHDTPVSSTPVSAIPQPKGRVPKMIELTLLDGTTVSLPAPRKSKPESTSSPEATAPVEEEIEQPPSTLNEDQQSGLTARDLVAALRAICGGANPNEILGPNERMEAIVAALLSVLLKKGVIADWEFVDELRKI